MTGYGKQVVHALIPELIACGFCIVSGLALGIDGEAHRTALAAAGGTVAVLGHGLDNIIPAEHEGLAEEILQSGGTLVSEFPPGTPALRHHFPRRNRILAGLCCGVLVIEAGERSGTQITARFAAEYGREVFAVPGPFTHPYSEGTKKLVNTGAKLVTSVADILESFGVQLKLPSGDEAIQLNKRQHKLLKTIHVLQGERVDILAAEMKIPVPQTYQLLLELEQKGVLFAAEGRYYAS